MKEKQLSQTPEAIKQREWRHKMTPEKRSEYLAKRRERFASTGIYEQRERRATRPGLTANYAKDWYSRHPERGRMNQKLYRDRMKAETFAVYGTSCACCGEDEMMFLTIDHIVPVQRRRERCGSAFYQALRKQGYPSGYQTLCFNCNAAKRTSPVCPHKAHYLKLLTAPRPV